MPKPPHIGRGRKMLTDAATKLAVHTLVTSRLDYCNCLLIGISDNHLQHLQNIQRTAARLISKKRKMIQFQQNSSTFIGFQFANALTSNSKFLFLYSNPFYIKHTCYFSNFLTDHTSNGKLRSTSPADSLDTFKTLLKTHFFFFFNIAHSQWLSCFPEIFFHIVVCTCSFLYKVVH